MVLSAGLPFREFIAYYGPATTRLADLLPDLRPADPVEAAVLAVGALDFR